MNLRGLNPRSDKGKAIKFSKYQWHPLWSYLFSAVHDEKGLITINSFARGAYENRGNKKFNNKQATRLSEILTEQEKLGYLRTFFRHQRWVLQETERELCQCKGIGCEACDFRGFRIPESKLYRFNLDDIHDLRDFLKDCGGFTFS